MGLAPRMAASSATLHGNACLRHTAPHHYPGREESRRGGAAAGPLCRCRLSTCLSKANRGRARWQHSASVDGASSERDARCPAAVSLTLHAPRRATRPCPQTRALALALALALTHALALHMHTLTLTLHACTYTCDMHTLRCSIAFGSHGQQLCACLYTVLYG